MRKLMLIALVAALAVPAMAEVTIEVVENGDPCKVDITYSCTGGDASVGKAKMAGLAIIVTLDTGDTIDAVDPFLDGPSTSGKPGYGVFMKTAQVNMSDPCNPVWAAPGTASPVATPGSPGEVGGLGENQITLELGALFADPCSDKIHAPGANGTLCTLTIDDVDGVTTIGLALEDTARGGVVMEGGADPCGVTLIGLDRELDCMVVLGVDTSNPTLYAMYQKAGSPPSWCEEYNCKGDAEGGYEGKDVYGKRIFVGGPDLAIFLAGWQKFDDHTNFANFISADADRGYEGKDVYGKRIFIGGPDLGIFLAGWQKFDDHTHFSTSPCDGY